MRGLRVPATLLLIGFSIAADLYAQDASGQAVHRCLGSHGEIEFSGLPCAANNAVDVAPADAASATESTLPANCPASREELRTRIAASIARHDANGLAGLLRWRGIGRGSAGSRMRALDELARRPLLAIDGADGAAETSEGMHVRTGSNETDGVREQSFGVLAEGGCYWLTWAD
jgi:hypothetical protein